MKETIYYNFKEYETKTYNILDKYMLYKLSDKILTREQILSSTIETIYPDATHTRTIRKEDILMDEEGYLVINFISRPRNAFFFMYSDGCVCGNNVEAGVYMLYNFNITPDSIISASIEYDDGVKEVESSEKTDILDYKALINDMGVGYNYGNVYDCHDVMSDTTTRFDTFNLWGNTKLNVEVIAKLKEAGFKTVRLPVTWYNHVDINKVIREDWMDEIVRAVGVILSADMYCILNVHHDTGVDGWLRADISKIDEMKSRLSDLWRQIANRFKDYNHKLIFEGFNEILNSDNQWSGVDEDCYIATQQLNQTFIDIVRDSGGYNKNRWLICSSYACNHDYYAYGEDVCDMVGSYLIPEDKANRILVQFHIYQDLMTSIKTLDRIYARFKKEDMGVVIGEWGMQNSSADIVTREAYAYGFARQCKELGFHCCWWDDGGYNGDDPEEVWNFGLIGKGSNIKWWYKNIADSIIKGWYNKTTELDHKNSIFNTIAYIRGMNNTDILDDADKTFIVAKLTKLQKSLSDKSLE